MDMAPGGYDDASIKLHYGLIKVGALAGIRLTHPLSLPKSRVRGQCMPTKKRGNPPLGVMPMSYHRVILCHAG